MSISFIRVDDRMIHGQTCTRWALEYPCDGLIAVNDKAATTPVLKAAYKNASDKKTFVWTLDEWRAKCGKVLASKDRYFLITKDPITMKSILVDDGFDPGEVKTVIIGPCNDRPGATKLGNNQAITQPEADALEAIMQKGYEVEFALIKGGRYRQLEEVPRSVRLLSSVSQNKKKRGRTYASSSLAGSIVRITRMSRIHARPWRYGARQLHTGTSAGSGSDRWSHHGRRTDGYLSRRGYSGRLHRARNAGRHGFR